MIRAITQNAYGRPVARTHISSTITNVFLKAYNNQR